MPTHCYICWSLLFSLCYALQVVFPLLSHDLVFVLCFSFRQLDCSLHYSHINSVKFRLSALIFWSEILCISYLPSQERSSCSLYSAPSATHRTYFNIFALFPLYTLLPFLRFLICLHPVLIPLLWLSSFRSRTSVPLATTHHSLIVPTLYLIILLFSLLVNLLVTCIYLHQVPLPE